MIFIIIFLLQWFTCINGQSYYTIGGTYSGTHYSDVFLSGVRTTGTHYSDAFLSGAQCILSSLHPKSSSDTHIIYSISLHRYSYLSIPNLERSHIASSNKDNQYISYIGSNIGLSTSKTVYSYSSISKYYKSHITSSNNHEQYISYIGSNNMVSISKKQYSYFSSTHLSSSTSVSTPLSSSTSVSTPLSSSTSVSTPLPSITSVPSPLSTPRPSVTPTPSLVPIISFDTKISFNNYNSDELDYQSQNAVIVATSSSMDISASFVKYIGTSVKARRMLKLLFFKTQGYNIVVLLQTTIPLSGKFAEYKTNPGRLYSTLTTKILNSVSSGDFAQYLQANSPSFANTTILSVENDNYVIVKPHPKKKEDFKTDFLSIIYVIIFSICLVIIIKIGYMIRKRLKCQVVNRQIQEPIYSNQI